MVKAETEIAWDTVMSVLSKDSSPEPSPQVPWMPQTVPPESLIRKWPATPALEPVPDQVPALSLLALEAVAIQSDGKVSVASSVPESAVAQSAGLVPVKISKRAPVPIVDSIASRRALLTATEYCMMGFRSGWRMLKSMARILPNFKDKGPARKGLTYLNSLM